MKTKFDESQSSQGIFWPGYLPAVVAVAYIVLSNWQSWGLLPTTMAVHFDMNGRPNGYMTKEGNLLLMLGVIAGLTVINFIIGTVWTNRHVRGKFNVFVVVYAELCAVFAWANHILLNFNLSASVTYSWSWKFAAAAIGSALVYSASIEFARSRRIAQLNPVEPGDHGGEPQSNLQLRNAARFYIEQRSNPWWWTPLIVVSLFIPLISIGVGIACIPPEGPEQVRTLLTWIVLPLILIIEVPILLCFLGGYRYSARADGLVVKLGFLGIPIKRIPISSIREVTVIKDFSPMAVFYGFGLRVSQSKRITGYCLCTGDAVKVETVDWTYILVMDEADDFGQVLKQAVSAN